MTAPIVWHYTRGAILAHGLPDLIGLHDVGGKFQRRVGTIPGQLWEREAARDVQAHGEPRLIDGLEVVRRGARVAEGYVFPDTKRSFIRAQIERRRPAMRATRAELDALRGVR